jgi:23S rRNA (guanosine2251-2'-O)-methyltransferase
VDQLETLFGWHPVEEALRAGRRRVEAVWAATRLSLPRREILETAAGVRGLRVQIVDPQRLHELAGHDEHQNVCARVGPLPLLELEALLEQASGASAPLYVALDNLQDPHNFGAIVRTALCVGASGVIIPKDRSAPPSPAVSKASAGALEHVRLTRVTNLVRSLASLKAAGTWIVGLDREAPESLFEAHLDGPLTLVLGSEDRGLRPLVRRHCDRLVSIPQASGFDSLNASVAAGVALYEAFRQRHPRETSRPSGPPQDATA